MKKTVNSIIWSIQHLRIFNTLFVLSLKSGDYDPARNSFDNYYMSFVEIKDFNSLINSKLFFDQPIKNKQEAYKKLVEISKKKRKKKDYTA